MTNTFTVGQQVRVIANPTDEFFKMMTGQDTKMHGLAIGDVTTIASIDEDGDIAIETAGFEFDRNLFQDAPHDVQADWLEAV